MTGTPTSWRDFVKVHPAADLFPMMSGDDLDGLVRDVAERGLLVPPVFWTPLRLQDMPGTRSTRRYEIEIYLLDGRNRLEAEWCNFDPSEKTEKDRADNIRWLTTAAIDGHRQQAILLHGDDDPWAFVISANMHRRHLDAEQKRAVIAALLRQRPERSNNATAKLANVSDKTVGAVRQEMERRSEIPNVSTRTDATGRQQPAHRPPPAAIVHRSSLPPPSKEAQLRQLRERQIQRADTPAATPSPTRPQPVDVLDACFGDLFRRLTEHRENLREVPLDRLVDAVLTVMARLGVTIEMIEKSVGEP